jgi:hypothetical protein
VIALAFLATARDATSHDAEPLAPLDAEYLASLSLTEVADLLRQSGIIAAPVTVVLTQRCGAARAVIERTGPVLEALIETLAAAADARLFDAGEPVHLAASPVVARVFDEAQRLCAESRAGKSLADLPTSAPAELQADFAAACGLPYSGRATLTPLPQSGSGPFCETCDGAGCIDDERCACAIDYDDLDHTEHYRAFVAGGALCGECGIARVRLEDGATLTDEKGARHVCGACAAYERSTESPLERLIYDLGHGLQRADVQLDTVREGYLRSTLQMALADLQTMRADHAATTLPAVCARLARERAANAALRRELADATLKVARCIQLVELRDGCLAAQLLAAVAAHEVRL